jgi:hypothetical protein
MMEDLKAAVNTVLKKSNPSNLTTDEIFAVVAYTFENDYGVSIYRRLSEVLRLQNPNNSEGKVPEVRGELLRWKEYLYYLMNGLQKLPEKSGQVFRGIGFESDEQVQEFAARYQVGSFVEWFGFSSTSTSKETAVNFININGGKGILFEIKLSFGRDVKAYSAIHGEHELLLLPNTSLVVSSNSFSSSSSSSSSSSHSGSITTIKMFEVDWQKSQYF